MGQGYSANSQSRRRPGDERVSQFPRDHFDGLSPLLGQHPDWTGANGIWQVQGSGCFADETLIRIAAASAELVVEMSDEKLPAILCGKGAKQG